MRREGFPGAMTIEEQIRQFIAENFMYTADVSELTHDLQLFDSGIIDSTGVLELVAFLEESYDIQVDDAEMLPENFASIAALAAFVRRKTSNAGE